MIQEQLEAFCEKNNIHRFESFSGVRNLRQVVQTLGYFDIEEFLSDNSGAMEAIVNWIGEQNVPEWKEKLEQ